MADDLCAHSGRSIVRQRSTYDCLLCALAMLMGRSYAEVHEAAVGLQPAYTNMTAPMTHSLMRRIAHDKGYVLLSGIYMDWSAPGIVGVLSQTIENCGHAVFWDGRRLIDPGGTDLYDRHYIDAHALEFTQRACDLVSLISLELELAPTRAKICLTEYH